MNTTRTCWLALLALALAAGAARAQAEDEALKKEALRLNNVTGDLLDPKSKVLDNALDPIKKDMNRARKLLAAAAQAAKEKDQPFNFAGAYILAALARDLKDYDRARLFLDIARDKADKLKSDRRLAAVYVDLIDLFFEHKKFDEAEKWSKEVLEMKGGLEINQAKVLALRRMVMAVAMQGKEDQAFKLLDPFLKAAGDDPAMQEINGWLLRHAGKYQESAKAYEKVMAQLEEGDLKDYVRYLLSGLYTDAGDIDKASENLQLLLRKKPDDATYNNDLGYIWADHDRNLDEAEKMIKKALEKEPNNPAFIDSMGWVLYKKKQYKEAKEYLLKAIQDEEGRHTEIYDHLAEVHKALGEKADALSAWKKAIEVSGTSKRDLKRKEEIEKKLKENM